MDKGRRTSRKEETKKKEREKEKERWEGKHSKNVLDKIRNSFSFRANIVQSIENMCYYAIWIIFILLKQ